jgi:hypothetical protein
MTRLVVLALGVLRLLAGCSVTPPYQPGGFCKSDE